MLKLCSGLNVKILAEFSCPPFAFITSWRCTTKCTNWISRKFWFDNICQNYSSASHQEVQADWVSVWFAQPISISNCIVSLWLWATMCLPLSLELRKLHVSSISSENPLMAWVHETWSSFKRDQISSKMCCNQDKNRAVFLMSWRAVMVCHCSLEETIEQ